MERSCVCQGDYENVRGTSSLIACAVVKYDNLWWLSGFPFQFCRLFLHFNKLQRKQLGTWILRKKNLSSETMSLFSVLRIFYLLNSSVFDDFAQRIIKTSVHAHKIQSGPDQILVRNSVFLIRIWWEPDVGSGSEYRYQNLTRHLFEVLIRKSWWPYQVLIWEWSIPDQNLTKIARNWTDQDLIRILLESYQKLMRLYPMDVYFHISKRRVLICLYGICALIIESHINIHLW